MNFASDNWAGAHPRINEALMRYGDGFAGAYGGSDLDRQVHETFSTLFERDVAVFFTATGTAANALSMSWSTRPGGVAFCHNEAHAIADEGGAQEFYTRARLKGVDGPLGRIAPAALKKAISAFPPGFVHGGTPTAVSITQSTEVGTVYALGEIDEIAGICRAHDLRLHMDGARFANALVSLDTTPAEMTWKRGVDILSFGGTKNGCWCAEAIIVFDPEKAADLPALRMRAGQLFSKSRFVAAQFEAYLADDLWLKNARHANQMARALADVFEKSNALRIAWQPEANEVFAVIKKDAAARLGQEGARFYPWALPEYSDLKLEDDEELYRFVTSFYTSREEIDAIAERLQAA